MIDSLEKIYGETDESHTFESRIMELANRVASEMAPDIVSDQLSMSVEGSILEELDALLNMDEKGEVAKQSPPKPAEVKDKHTSL